MTENMHFSIPETIDRRDGKGSNYTVMISNSQITKITKMKASDLESFRQLF